MSDAIPTAEELAALLPDVDFDTDNVVFEVESWQALAELLRLVRHNHNSRLAHILHPANESLYSPDRIARMIEVGAHCIVELLAGGDLAETLSSDKRTCQVAGLVTMTNVLEWVFQHSETDLNSYAADAEMFGYGIECGDTDGADSDEDDSDEQL